ncbi:MAG: Gfo/Idh/MocA family oxidoreductase [Bryobacteraceae bacterium]|nr:Gfo/Idh/MocA family oxidoreductase [Bryobacteraceae bacterium]MDW8377197.1 Gfo/Idh/MocA family oxidoreductase [Bryobacterales bacterium]
MQRRQLLAATLAATPLLGQPAGRKFRTALIGSGWWGTNILREAIASGECRAVALCDPDPSQMEKTAGELAKISSDQPKRYLDYREMLSKERPDIAIVATPDHWHALPTIEAVKAGAHVYVEKPIAHTIDEGKAMVRAAREAGRVVQVGLHRRVSPHPISGMQFLKSGKVGKIGMVRMFAHSAGQAGSKTPDSDPPPGMDWDLWLGPAPKRPFNKAIHPRGFRQFLDFANGTLGDWGVHWLDQLLWWTEETHPKRVYSTGGRFIRQDSTDAPDTQIVTYEFETFRATWEQRHYGGNNAEHHAIGAYFYGTEGTFHMGWRDGWTFYPADPKHKPIHVEPQLNAPDGQNIKELWADFLDAIRNKRKPVRDIEIGYRATAASLLGMVSWRLGRAIPWDGHQCPGDAEANRLLRRPYREPWVYPS